MSLHLWCLIFCIVNQIVPLYSSHKVLLWIFCLHLNGFFWHLFYYSFHMYGYNDIFNPKFSWSKRLHHQASTFLKHSVLQKEQKEPIVNQKWRFLWGRTLGYNEGQESSMFLVKVSRAYYFSLTRVSVVSMTFTNMTNKIMPML